MENIVAIVQARMGSTRLPSKVLADLAGKPMLARIVERAQAIPLINECVIATTTQPEDDTIEEFCHTNGLACFRGSTEDVLDRFYQCALWMRADHVARMTGDDPLVAIQETNRLLAHHLESAADYTHNVTVFGSGMPLGAHGEIFTFNTLERSWYEGQEPHHREHVDEYVFEHPELFAIEMLQAPPNLHFPDLRLTVDTPEDLDLMCKIYTHFSQTTPLVDLPEVVEFLTVSHDLRELNQHVVQKRY